jgi:tRNA G18 (ribose-2'-O)-methylase SpoU
MKFHIKGFYLFIYFNKKNRDIKNSQKLLRSTLRKNSQKKKKKILIFGKNMTISFFGVKNTPIHIWNESMLHKEAIMYGKLQKVSIFFFPKIWMVDTGKADRHSGVCMDLCSNKPHQPTILYKIWLHKKSPHAHPISVCYFTLLNEFKQP